MSLTASVIERARTPGGQKAIRYTLVSVIAVCVSQVSLFVLFGVLDWTARSATIAANVIGGIPSYYLNRRWAWGKSGRSHLMREVVPFWALAFIGLAFSTWAADYAEDHAASITDARLGQAVIIMGAALAAFGILWVGKFILFNKVIFVHRADELAEDPALDGRTGLPT